jgi:hypothetical protein
VILDCVHWQAFAFVVLKLRFMLDSLLNRYLSLKLLNVFNIRSSIPSSFCFKVEINNVFRIRDCSCVDAMGAHTEK